MNILTLLGSPRINGNTATALTWVESRLTSSTVHTVTRINLAEKKMAGILPTHYHKYAGGPALRGDDALSASGFLPGVDDETDAILDAMVNADLCILATPLFCWSFSALLMQLIERMSTLVTGYGTPSHDSQVKAKPIALLVTAAGPIENNAELLPTAFSRMCDFMLAKNAGHFIIPRCSSPDALSNNADARSQAEHFAAALLDQCS